MRQLVIDGVRINDQSDAYIIAEIGHNHGGDLQTCKKMFKAAKDAGASAVKLQKRDNKTLYTTEYYNSPYNSENAYGRTYGEHREALEFNRTQYIILQEYALELEITFFATAFDIPSADFLAELDMPAFKIASGDLNNEKLLKHVASIGKPVIISTGGGTLNDVRRAASWFQYSPIGILQCTSGYPASYDELNLRVIETYSLDFPHAVIGYSGHENGIAISIAAFTLGARIIEKHFTLDRTLKGTDQAFSLEPVGLRKLVRDLKRTKRALGDGIKRSWPSETVALAKQWKNKEGKIDGRISAA